MHMAAVFPHVPSDRRDFALDAMHILCIACRHIISRGLWIEAHLGLCRFNPSSSFLYFPLFHLSADPYIPHCLLLVRLELATPFPEQMLNSRYVPRSYRCCTSPECVPDNQTELVLGRLWFREDHAQRTSTGLVDCQSYAERCKS